MKVYQINQPYLGAVFVDKMHEVIKIASLFTAELKRWEIAHAQEEENQDDQKEGLDVGKPIEMDEEYAKVQNIKFEKAKIDEREVEKAVENIKYTFV